MTRGSDQIEAEAAEWLICVDSAGSPHKWAQLDAWLAQSPRHRAAFLRLSAGWRRAERLRDLKAFDGSIDVDLLNSRKIHRWRAAERQPRRHFKPALGWGLAAAAAVAAIYFIEPFLSDREGVRTYVTKIGDRQHIQLGEGSTVDLNTNSELRIWFSKARRQVILVRGEAAFKVVHNPRRPFDVTAGKSLVRVLGTTFSIRLRDEARVDVRVTEGQVAVSPPAAVLNPGDTAQWSAGHVEVAHEPVDILRRRLQWIEGRLFFNGETLADAVSEFNRYNRRSLVIADPKIASLRISGTFEARDPQGFITSLENPLRIRAAPDPSGATSIIRLEGKDK